MISLEEPSEAPAPVAIFHLGLLSEPLKGYEHFLDGGPHTSSITCHRGMASHAFASFQSGARARRLSTVASC